VKPDYFCSSNFHPGLYYFPLLSHVWHIQNSGKKNGTKSSISPSFWFYHLNKSRFWSGLWNGNLMLVSTDFVISIWFDLKSSSGEPSGNLKNWKQLIIAEKCRTWRLWALEKKLIDTSINFIVCFINQISILYRLYNNENYKTKTNTSKKNSNYSQTSCVCFD